jgi:hypothetical protein
MNFNSFQELIARVLLVSLFLQSCGGFNNPFIPTGTDQTACFQTDLHSLADKTISAASGHLVTFYEAVNGEIKASVEFIDEKDKVYDSVPVVIEKGTELRGLPHLPKKVQQARVQISFSQAGEPVRVVVHQQGLLGGMEVGEEEEVIESGSEDELEDEAIPDECFCPITWEIIEDPVIAQDGHTYERAAIQRWFDKGKRISPKTGARMLNNELTPNYTLRSLIYDIKQQIPILFRHRLDIQNIDVAIKRQEAEIEALEEKTAETIGLKEEERRKRARIEKIGEEEEPGLIEQQEVYSLPTIMPELWQYIFSHLNFEDILSARAVNRDWNQLITGFRQVGVVGVDNKPSHIIDTRAWVTEKRIYLHKSALTDIPSFAFYCLMGHVADLPQSFWPYLKETRVHTLDLYGNQIGDAGASELAKVLPATRVHTLCLNWNQIGDEGAIELAKALPGTQMHTLDLVGNKIGAQGAIQIVKALQGTQVHTLNLGDNRIRDAGARELAKALQGTSVHTLNLAGNRIGAAGAIELAKHLPKSKVHILNLFANDIGDRGAKALAECLLQTQIHTLNLCSIGIGDEGVRALAEYLPQTQIHRLNLDANDISDEGIKALAECLPQSQIHTLNILPGEEGLRALAKCLPRTQIHTLDLRHSGIRIEDVRAYFPQTRTHTLDLSICTEEEGVRALAECLPQTQIHTLDFGYNDINTEGLRALVRYLPQTQIHTLKLNICTQAEKIETLAKCLPQTQIHTLDLGYGFTSTEGLRALVQYLPQTQIHTLQLNGNLLIGTDIPRLLVEQYSYINSGSVASRSFNHNLLAF